VAAQARVGGEIAVCEKSRRPVVLSHTCFFIFLSPWEPVAGEFNRRHFNLTYCPTDKTGAFTETKLAKNNQLCATLSVTKFNVDVPLASFRLVRHFLRAVPPTDDDDDDEEEEEEEEEEDEDTLFPDTDRPSCLHLHAMSTAFMYCDIDCGTGTCIFYKKDELAALRQSAQEYALETFWPSLLKSALQKKDENLSDADLAHRVTPERVAAVIQYVPHGGRAPGGKWHVDTTAAAWADMGITPADVVARLKEVDKFAGKSGISARV
jgi:hypothetical protein